MKTFNEFVYDFVRQEKEPKINKDRKKQVKAMKKGQKLNNKENE